jgi:hypothetical protein
MRRVFVFECRRAGKDGWLAALALAFPAAFAVYAFTLHLSAAAAAGALPLNISYAGYALIRPLALAGAAAAFYAAAAFRRDRTAGWAATILTQGIGRRQYFWGKTWFALAVLAGLIAVLAAEAWLIANSVFEGRYPISVADLEVRPAALVPGLVLYAAAAWCALAPLVALFAFAGFVGLPPLVLLGGALAAVWPAAALSARLAAPGILVDYAFEFGPGRIASPETAALAAGGLALLVLVAAAAARPIERVDF